MTSIDFISTKVKNYILRERCTSAFLRKTDGCIRPSITKKSMVTIIGKTILPIICSYLTQVIRIANSLLNPYCYTQLTWRSYESHRTINSARLILQMSN